ncbi:hypothetical protein [Thioclava sp. SK-1]|nr:hypothetical protein [Thioclava sp. SK-1]
MSNSIALGLAALIVAAILADCLLNSGGATLFLARKTADLVDYLKFWR